VPWTYRDPTTIPPREWLIGTTILRGYASLFGAMGGVGKTAWAIAHGLAFITGRHDVTGQHVFQRGKVWFLTLEDDRDELDRRIAAAMIAHGIGPEEVEGKLFINSASERPLLLAKADHNGPFVVCDDVAALKNGIKAMGIGLTVIDPLVKSHAVLENSNEHMDKLAGTANSVACQTNTGVLLLSHFRKGGGEDGARDAVRGGSALVDAMRVVRTLTAMSRKEAAAFKIPPDQGSRYVRIHDAKSNLAPKNRAMWFELLPVPLGNTAVNPLYTAGDNVQAARPWQPPAAQGISAPALECILAKLREGAGAGWFYSSESRSGQYWAGTVIMQKADQTKQEAAATLKKWIDAGVLLEQAYKTPHSKDRTKVVVNEAKAADLIAQAWRSDDSGDDPSQ
jgi:hypothetical protein